MKRMIIITTLAATLSLSAGSSFAAEQVYGSQLMTQQERTEYRAKMLSAKTIQERERIREEHHEMMKERARSRGLELPDEPPILKGGMGQGKGGGR